MSAFNKFKASVPVAWSPNLYITLVRGIPGTRRLHRRTLEALRLGKCNRTVMRWNTPTVRGMLQQVLLYRPLIWFLSFCFFFPSLGFFIWGILCVGEKVGCGWDGRNVQGTQREWSQTPRSTYPYRH